MSENIKINDGVRSDGLVFPGVSFSKKDSIQETYTLVEYLQSHGETEDDFVIGMKPVLVSKVDLQAQIEEQAKGTDLKSLIAQVLRTGDESLLNQRNVSFGDATLYPRDAMEAQNVILKGQASLESLPDDLKSKGVESILNMTREELDAYIQKLIDAKVGGSATPEPTDKKEIKESEVKK